MRVRKWIKDFSDLELEISFADQNILALLYLRDVWRVTLEPDIPPLFPRPSGRDMHKLCPMFPSKQWNSLWKESYDQMLVVQRNLKLDIGGSAHLPPTSPYVLFTQLDADYAEFSKWVRSCIESYHRTFPKQSTVSKLVPTLTSAVRAGLKKIIIFPVEGSYYKWVGNTVLIISPSVENSRAVYSAALSDYPNEYPN